MADERDGMTPDSSAGARLRALSAKWNAKAERRYADAEQLRSVGEPERADKLEARADECRQHAGELESLALLLVSESPSCMVCGQTKPFKASHGNYPSIGVCYACHDAREILGAIVASAYRHPPEGVQPRDCALQLVPTELIVKAEVLLS